MISQGDIYWIDLYPPTGSEPGYSHAHVIVQNNLFNRSRIRTVVVCPLTSNLRLAKAPGNVLLEQGEAGLLKQSVVNVSQVFTVDKSQLGEFIGVLPARRVQAILAGIYFVLEPRDVE